MTTREIINHQFRTNPAYTLTAYDRLSPEEQEHLAKLATGPDFYGVISNGIESKAVDPETALLVLSLQEPGAIPAYVRHKFGRQANQAVAELVLDDILQIAVGERFLSGPLAHNLIYESAEKQPNTGHPLAKLSFDALRYGRALPPMAHGRLAQRLYMFNTIPITPLWQERLPSSAAVEQWLSINGWMEPIWQRTDIGQEQGWISWRHRLANGRQLLYKLYISPRPETLPRVFRPLVEILAQRGVPSFKIGKNVNGLLRPDKMVAYLPTFESLAELAATLEPEFADCEPQGVPFTAPIDQAGILSWGMDPPDSAQVFTEDGRESWRYWIVQQLASALNSAKRSDSEVDPIQFALDRLQLDGVDTTNWVPRQSIWQQED